MKKPEREKKSVGDDKFIVHDMVSAGGRRFITARKCGAAFLSSRSGQEAALRPQPRTGNTVAVGAYWSKNLFTIF